MPLTESSSAGLRPFANLLASEVLNTTSTSIVLVATPLIAITALDANAMQVGLLAAAGTAAPLLFGLSAGAIADRLDRRKVMLLCGFARLALLAALPFLFYFGLANIAILCLVSFGISVVKLFFDSVVIAVIPTIVPKCSLTKANSWYEAANSTAYTLGPALAGWILQTLSATAVYAANSILYLASTLLIRKTAFPHMPNGANSSRSHFSDIADGVKLLWRNEIQRTVALAAGLFNMFHTGFFTVFTLYALKELKFSAASFGTIVSMVGMAGLFGAIFAPRLINVLGVRTALVGTLLVIGPLGVPILFAAHLPFVPRAALIAGCLAAWDFFIVVHVIIEQTLRQVMVRNDQLSRITATTRFVSWGADPIGAVIGGLAASSMLGNRGTLFVCLIGFVISGAALLMSKAVRQLNADDLAFHDEPVTGDS
jgi:MFS family permease